MCEYYWMIPAPGLATNYASFINLKIKNFYLRYDHFDEMKSKRR